MSAQDFFPSTLRLSNGEEFNSFKDSNGRCWELVGFDENVENITDLPTDFQIIDNYPCCEMCLSFENTEIDLLEDILLEPEFP